MNLGSFFKLAGEPVEKTPPVSIPIRQLGIKKVVFVRTRKNGGITTKKIEVKQIDNCEWIDCDKDAEITTSTELTESGIIKLCPSHFDGLPI